LQRSRTRATTGFGAWVGWLMRLWKWVRTKSATIADAAGTETTGQFIATIENGRCLHGQTFEELASFRWPNGRWRHRSARAEHRSVLKPGGCVTGKGVPG